MTERVSTETGVRRAPMSMYAELLAASFDEQLASAAATPVSDLLAHVIACRRVLADSSPPGTGPEGDLAANIEYDLALLRLCASRGIDGDPHRFDRPREERARLEAELARRGVDLDGRAP